MATVKLPGVPKKFASRERALLFLRSSPGYVERQKSYLQKNFPEVVPRPPTPQAKAWAAPRSIFVPEVPKVKPKNIMPGTEFKPTPKPKNVMPGTEYQPDKHPETKKEASTRRKSELKAMTKSATDRRKTSLGLKAPKAGKTITDAVPEYTPPPSRRVHLGPLSVPRFIPGTDTEIEDAARITGTVAKSLPGAFAEGIRPVANLIIPNPAGLNPRRGGDIKTPGDLAKKYEEATEAVAGKSIANVAFHGDLPKNWGEAGGLAAGVATIGPLGKVGRATGVAGKVIFDAVKAEKGIMAAVEAGKVAGAASYRGPSNTTQIIKWARAARRGKVGTAQVESVRANAGMLVDMRRAALSQGDTDTAAQLEQILAKADLGPNGEFHGWDPAAGAKREASKNNPKNKAKGIPYKNPIVESKTSPGIVVAGPVTNEQWFQKMIAAFPTKGERQQWAQWYDEFAPAFREMFGDQAEELMRGFAVSQANNSPTGGLLASLRVIDRLMAGDTAKTITNKGIGTKSLIKTIAKATEGADGKVDQGVAAKLSDFIDSFLKKDTRTWMGDIPSGGKPSAIDVHAMRDLGLIDKKLAAKLTNVHGLTEGVDFVVDSQGAASGPLYERLSERYEEIAQMLNDMDGGAGFDGRNNWEPREVQALGWGATQKTHGVDPENLGTAFSANTRRYNLGGTPGLGAGLTVEESAQVADTLAPYIDRIVAETDGVFPVEGLAAGTAEQAGKAGAKAGANASLHLRVMGSPEKAQGILDRLATNFPGFEVWAYKVGGGTAKPALQIGNVPDAETAARIFDSLQAQDPKRFKQGYHFADGEMTMVSAGKRPTVAEQPAWNEAAAALVSKAADEVGLPADHVLESGGINLQILKGNPNGKSLGKRVRGGGRGSPLGSQTDAEARAAYDEAVAGVLDARPAEEGVEQGGILSRLASEERGEIAIPSQTGVRDLDDILADHQMRSLTVGGRTQQLQSARGRGLPKLIERGAERVSESLEGTRVGRLPFAFNASSMGRVMRHAGREAAQEAHRARGKIVIFEKALPKKAETPVDIAHYWYAQLPEAYRNEHGLSLIRDKWHANYMELRDGTVMDDLQSDLAEVLEELKNWEGPGKPYDLLGEKARIQTAITDVPVLLKTMPEQITRLDSVISEAPEYNPRIIRGLRGIAADRESVLFEAGVLKADDAEARNGLVSNWLGLEPDGNEIFMGHRMGDVRGASAGGLPAKYALGRPRSASGIGRMNRQVLVNNARARQTTHIAMDDWLSAQTYKMGLQARQDLGEVGEVFDMATFDPHSQVLVNPKSRSIPVAWKEAGRDLLEDAVQVGYDEEIIRKAADDLVHSYSSIPGDQASYERVLEQARADGVDYDELRVVSKQAAERYYQQIARPAMSSLGGRAYDMAVDAMVASIVFGRIGYIPKNFAANLIMVAPHQGIYSAANFPRATQLLTAGVRGSDEARHLTYMMLADVGQGASETLGREFTSTLARSGRTGMKVSRAGRGAKEAPGKLAHTMSLAADAPFRMSAFLHEAAAMGVIPKLNPVLHADDIATLTRLFEDERYRPILNDIRSRTVESMADFSRLTAVQSKWARRFLIVPGWLWAGTRYPIHFGATHPIRTAAIGYAAFGEPYADRLGLPQNHPLSHYMNSAKEPFLKGIKTPWGILRTGSISPISTPIELVHTAISMGPLGVVGENANPFAVALWHIANSEIESPSGGAFKVGQWEAVKANLERLFPNVKFAREVTYAPNKDSKFYPEDATRWGRFLRELGVVPIEVSGDEGGAAGGGGAGADITLDDIPMPDEDSAPGFDIPMPDEDTGEGGLDLPMPE